MVQSTTSILLIGVTALAAVAPSYADHFEVGALEARNLGGMGMKMVKMKAPKTLKGVEQTANTANAVASIPGSIRGGSNFARRDSYADFVERDDIIGELDARDVWDDIDVRDVESENIERRASIGTIVHPSWLGGPPNGNTAPPVNAPPASPPVDAAAPPVARDFDDDDLFARDLWYDLEELD